MNKFFTTALGGYVKTFLSTILAMYIAEGADLWSIDCELWKKFISAGVASIVPIAYNALNPQDKRYGRKKKETDIYTGKL
jgi:hypothetical protein